MKIKKIYLLLFPLFLLIFYFLVFKIKPSSLNLKKITIGNTEILVEIADTPEKRERGLSERDFLPENQGMLFIFEKPDYYSFWMKGMRFPLDFVWINGDTVVEITQNVKPEDLQPPKVLKPSQPVDKVLEINNGVVKRYGINVGDKIKIK
ncbi:MAG: DUF192 domain-containing protein [Microgenomates group bacterium]